MVNATSGSPGYVKKKAEHTGRTRKSEASPHGFCFSSCLEGPALNPCPGFPQ